MKKLKFEKVSNKLTKEELNVLKGGVGFVSGGNNTKTGDTKIVSGSYTAYEQDYKQDSGTIGGGGGTGNG